MLGNSESVEPVSNRKSEKKKKDKNKSKEVMEERVIEEVKQKQEPRKSQQKNATQDEEKNKTVTKTKSSTRMKPDKDTESKLTADNVCKAEASADQSERFTEDGFKLTSVIPDDDSDVSDAFDCDSEEEDAFSHAFESRTPKISSQPKKGAAKVTEDGFEIVRDIPPDDSDVSDAFEDDDEGLGSDQDTGLDNHRSDSLRNVKKPILQMMNDFG